MPSSITTEAGITEAISLHQKGDLTGAEGIYRRVLATSPDDADALRLLGALRFQRKDGAEAEALLRRAISIAPDNAKAHDNYGFVLHGLGRSDEALPVLRRAVELAPDNSTLQLNLANLLIKMTRFAEAVAVLRRLVETDQDNLGVHQMLGAQLLKIGEAAAARHHLELCITRGYGNASLFAHQAVALSETGDTAGLRRLMDFDRLVVPAFIGDGHGRASLAEFNAVLGARVAGSETLHHDVTTVNGMDTGEYLAAGDPCVVSLRKFIEEQVVLRLRSLPERGHPFADHVPERWKMVSWGVRMWRQGYQVAHIHHHAWLSGVYYVQLPDVINDRSNQGHEGWIEFGRGRSDLYTSSQPELKLIQPVEGMLLTFPSYMWHRTIPFESPSERISVAFDVLPIAAARG